MNPEAPPEVPGGGGGALGRRRFGLFLAAGLLVSLVLAGVVSNVASDSPDGLESVTRSGCTFDDRDVRTGGVCVAGETRDHDLADSPLAGYGVRGVSGSFLSTGLSGVIGVLVVFSLGGVVFRVLRRHGGPAGGTSGATTDRVTRGASG